MNQTKLWAFRGMMLLSSLFAVNANAVNIPITSVTSTAGTLTPTGTCVIGYLADSWTTAGKYFQYQLSTTGYTGAITMDFKTTRSSTGPQNFQIWYSINNGPEQLVPAADGGTFTVTTSCVNKTATLPAACAGVADLKVRLKAVTPLPTNAAGTFRADSSNVFDAASSGCTGTPAQGGTVSAANASVCAGSGTTLTLTGATGGAGITYQWQSSPNGTTWTAISGATGLSYTTPGLTAATQYRVIVSCGANATNSTSATVSVNTVSVAPITAGYTNPMNVGATQTLANVTGGGTWSSSDASVASIDLISGAVTGVFGGTSTITYSVTDGVTGCIGTSSINLNVVWPNTLALYAGVNGTSTSVINVPGDVTSALSATGFGGATPCNSGGLSGLTVNVNDSVFSLSGPYVGYKVAATTGNVLNMFRIHARARVSGTGPTKARIAYRYWQGGLAFPWQAEAADVNLVSGNCGASANSWDYNTGIAANPNPTFNGIDSLEVAVFPFKPGANTGTFQLNDLEVYGIVTTNANCSGTSIVTNADSVLPRVVNVCDSGSRFLNYNVGFGGITGLNILYQWQRSDNKGASWFDIPFAEGIVYQTPVLHAGVDPDTVMYRMQITCDATSDVAYSAANIVTVHATPANAGTISGGLTGGLIPYRHMLIGTNYTLSSTVAGGTWSSNDTSAISIVSGTGVATPHIPGDAVITYRTSVGGCTGISRDTVVSYYPRTKALYVGKYGNSVNLYAAAGVTAANLTTTNFGTTTPCGNGGISGLTNATTTQDPATNGRLTTVVTGAFTADTIRATLRKTNSGAYKAYLAYKPVSGSTWTFSAPVDVETDDCGYSHNEVVFALSPTVPVTGAGVEFGVIAYNGTAALGFQANSISVIGNGTQLINGGIVSATANNNIQLFPNPATNVLNVTAAEKVNVTIFSIEGKKLIEQKDAKRIDVSSLVSGMYLIQVYGENNALLKAEKFIKK